MQIENNVNEEPRQTAEIDSIDVLRGELGIRAESQNYRYFATQFAHALQRWHTAQVTPPKPADNGIWFGKLIAFPYSLKNFENRGEEKSGQEFWDELRTGIIQVIEFRVDAVGNYRDTTPAGAIFKTATVTMFGNIVYEKNGQRSERSVTVTHNIEQTWYATSTVFA